MSQEPPISRTQISYLAKIVEAAANADYSKVCAYAEKLSDDLESTGEVESAKRIRQGIGQSKARKLSLARSSGVVSARGNDWHVPVDGESRLAMANEENISPSEVEVFLTAEVASQIDRFLKYFRASDQLFSAGVGVAASMLLFGPPGCGKTQIARYIAAQLGLPLITARTDGVISSYLGSTAKNVRLLFEHAMSRPCVLFLDEFDALAKMRDDSRELGELKRVVISLLQNIDAMGKDHILIAATNHEHLLDPAIWRRFNFIVRVSDPDFESRRKIISRGLGNFDNAELSELLSLISEGISGAVLHNAAENLRRHAIIDSMTELSWSDAIRDFVLLRDEWAKNSSAPSTSDIIKTIRSIDPKTFTQARMSKIFGISQSQVSKITR